MSQLENNDTLRTEKLEIEIKKLIEEINADDNNKKTVDNYLDGQGDVDLKANRKSITNKGNDFCGLNTKLHSESEFMIDENETVVTRKFCRIDLLNHENKLHMACNEFLLPEMDDVELEQDYWERSQEHELQVIDPEYSDSEEIDTDLQTFEAYGGEFFDIDLCCVTKLPPISDSSDNENEKPVKDKVITNETQEAKNVDKMDGEEPKSKKSNEKKLKKKRGWSFGRILNFFTNKSRPRSDLRAAENKI